jgi:hypothetical protein
VKNPAHTPGEWYAFRHEHHGTGANGECYRIEIRGNPYRVNGNVVGSEPVCTLHAGFVHFEGNAALILAAPSLLAACEWLLTTSHRQPCHCVRCEDARAAVAKAKGQSPLPIVEE